MSIQVGKLTVRGARRDAGFLVRTGSRLRALDLQPPGLPGHAILVVRRLELAAVDRAGAQRARADLDRLRQAAARPADGPVAPSAAVVLFRDEVELLACLTADLVHGAASRRWYWHQIDRGRPAGPGAALAAAWLRDVRWLPGSLARLPESEVQQAVSLLSPREAAGVLRALLSAFGAADQPVPPRPEPTRLPSGPPWQRWLGPTSLPPEAEALWGVALSLHHAPAVVRGPGYARDLAAWRAATAQATSFRPGTHEEPAHEEPAHEEPVEGAPAERHPARRAQGEGWPADEAPRPMMADRGAMPVAGTAGGGRVGRAVPAYGCADGRAARAEGPPDAGTPSATAAGGTGVASPSRPGQRVTESTEPGAADLRGEARAGRPAWADEGIVTSLASMLFLVNFVVWLDDRPDPPWPAGWALVDLLVRYLLGDRLANFAGDPLWDVLAELDGRRPGTVPAVGLGPADPVRLPRAWLERWPPPAEAAWLGDVGPAAGGPAEPESPAEPENHGPGRRFDLAAGAFVSWLLRSRGIATTALATPGRVLVTGTHVDVVLSLRDIDLAVRVAGLDRDPGWVPALGRIVLFHFLDEARICSRRAYPGQKTGISGILRA